MFHSSRIQRAWRKHKGKSFDYSDGGHDACQDHLLGDQSVVHIRTNPFSDQESDDEDDGNSDISNDSLEQSNEVNNYKNNQECNPDQEGIDSDLYSDEALGLDAVTTPIDLLSPTTDWESIESCLKSQGGGQDYDNNDLTDLQKKKLTDFKLKANNLQICFVDDDGMLSDADGSVDGCEVREYIINKQDLSEEEKRDSGCVAGDEEGTEPFSIKTVNPEVLENTRVSPEDLQQVMLELSGQDSDEELEERSRYQGWTRERLEELTLEELKELRNNMSQVIAGEYFNKSYERVLICCYCMSMPLSMIRECYILLFVSRIRNEALNQEVVGSIPGAGSSRKVFIRGGNSNSFPFRTCLLSMGVPPTRPNQLLAETTTKYKIIKILYPFFIT